MKNQIALISSAVALALASGSAFAEFHGTIGAGAHFEVQRHNDHTDHNGSEMEYDLLKAKFTNTELEGWTFNTKITREVAYDGALGANDKSDGTYGHNDNTYTIGAHKQLNDNWGIKFGYEYENKSNGYNEYTIAPDFSMALSDTTDFYAILAVTHQRGNGDKHGTLAGQSNDSNWYWGVTGISTELNERTSAGIDVYYDRELGLSDNNYEYAEWDIRPSVTTELDNGMGLTVAVFWTGEQEEDSTRQYSDYWYGTAVDLDIPVNARLSVSTGLAWEQHYRAEGAMSDYYEPSGHVSFAYKF